jgi:hypothetical protein
MSMAVAGQIEESLRLDGPAGHNLEIKTPDTGEEIRDTGGAQRGRRGRPPLHAQKPSQEASSPRSKETQVRHLWMEVRPEVPMAVFQSRVALLTRLCPLQ